MKKNNLKKDTNQIIKEKEQKKKTFNGLSAREWASLSMSVWNDVSSVRAKKHLNHGATYPEKLCDRLIKMYSKKNDVVLDPFLGTGTTMISSLKNGRKSVGIELTDRFYKVCEESINNYYLDLSRSYNKIDASKKYNLIKGDCLSVLPTLKNNSIQLTITSPPYADLIHKVVKDRTNYHKKSAFVIENNSTSNPYSSDPRDLGNMDLEKYTEKVKEIMKMIYDITKPGGYNAWVVKDFRDTKNNIPYVNLHEIISNCGESAGFKLHDLIIWDQNVHRKLVLLGYPSVFYVNQNHSFIVVLRKPANARDTRKNR